MHDDNTTGDTSSDNTTNHAANDSAPRTPVWYWVVAVFALLWNLLGCTAFATELFAQEAMMEAWSEEQKEWAESIPAWIYFVYGIAVTTGVAGSVCLFVRKTWAFYFFAVSLAAVLVQMIYTMVVAGGLHVMGASAAIMPTLVIMLGVVFLWFSTLAKKYA